MEVKPGYKQTEVGVIPEDWEVRRVGDICGFIVPGRNKPTNFQGDIPWITTPDIEDGRSVSTSRLGLCISREEAKNVGSKIVPAGSVLMSCAGELGIVALTKNELVINQQLHAFIPSSVIDGPFLSYAIKAQKSYVDGLATKTAVPYLNKYNCNSIPIPLPPPSEQRAIAGALGDVDALLDALEKLIAKKRDLKQAAMKQLFTGKIRLPGFTGKWDVKAFGELFQFLNTANNPRADLSPLGDVGYIHYGDIHTTASAFLDCANATLPQIAKKKVANIALVQDGDLVMVDASEDYAGLGKSMEICNASGRQIVAGLHTFLLRGNRDFLADGFKGYLQFIPSVRASLVSLATGISVYGVSKTNVKSIELLLPSIDEQTAIAELLSDMDAEIAALEQRLAKTRTLKQGMMQELLTGRVRLV